MPRSTARLTALCAALVLAAVVPAVAPAAPFDPLLVGGHAKFVAFIDFDHARTTAVGKTIIEYVRQNPRYIEVEQQLLEHVGLMPLSDVHDVTLWGEQLGREPKAVLAVRATFNAKALRFAAGFTPGFDVVDYHGQELMSWADQNHPGQRVFACIQSDDTVLFGNDAAVVKRGIDVLADAGESLKPEAEMPVPTDESTWAFAAAMDFAGKPDAKTNPVAGQLRDALFELTETGEKKTVLRLTGTALTDEAGPRLLRMAEGATMLAQIAASRARPATQPDAADDPRAAMAAMAPGLLAGVCVDGHGRSVDISLSADNDTAVKILNKLAEAHEAEQDAAGK